MANLRGPGGMKQLNLIASWKDSQRSMSKDEPTKMTGAFLTIEKDQSTMTQKAAKEGLADTNPFIESHNVESDKGTYTSHNVWYSERQMATMMEAGQMAKQTDGRNAVAFKGDVQKSKSEKTGESCMIVLTSKDPSKAKNDVEKAQIAKYNEAHPMGPSDNTKFDTKSLEKQAKITALAKENRPKEADKVVEMEHANEAVQSQPEA